MFLGIGLIAVSLAALLYGIKTKNRTLIVASVVALAVIAVIWAVYTYLYSLTPY